MTDPNPNRIAGSPAFGEPALGLSPVSVVERSPTGLAMLPQVLIKVATVLVALAVVGLTVFALFLPAPWAATAVAICTGVIGVGSVLGIASPGLRTQAGTQPVTLAQPSLVTPSTPRVGPPV